MTGTPLLITERFELWQPAIRDHQSLFALTADAVTRRFLGDRPSTMQDSFERVQRNAGCWALHGYGTLMVRRKGESDIVGTCGVFRSWRDKPGLDDVPEAGWIVHRDLWGQGFAGEVMRAIIAWFDLVHGAQRIGCMIESGNTASERLAAALGFTEYHREVEDERTMVLHQRGA